MESVPQSMVALPLGHEEALIIVAAPAYLERHGTPLVPADLLAHDCLRSRLPSGAMMRWEVEKAGEPSTIDITGRLVLGTTELTLKAAIGGAGIAYVMARDAEPSLQSGARSSCWRTGHHPFPASAFFIRASSFPPDHEILLVLGGGVNSVSQGLGMIYADIERHRERVAGCVGAMGVSGAAGTLADVVARDWRPEFGKPRPSLDFNASLCNFITFSNYSAVENHEFSARTPSVSRCRCIAN